MCMWAGTWEPLDSLEQAKLSNFARLVPLSSCPENRQKPEGLDLFCFPLLTQLQVQGSDAREMVMMSLVHEHNRSMNAHHAAKRARIAAGHAAPQPQFSGGP